MSLASAMMPATTLPVCDLLDARDFPDRNALIGFLVSACGWSTAKVGAMFDRSDRQVRRIAREEERARRVSARSRQEPLTRAEVEMMLRDYAVDPYTSAAEREAAREWIHGPALLVMAGGECRGIEDFGGITQTGAAADCTCG